MSDFESKIDINIDAGQALAAIKTLQRQISDFHTSLAKGSATANIKSLQMQQTLIDTINATGQYSAQMKTVASSTQAFTTALEKNKLSMGQYFRYAGGASKSFGRFFKTEMDTIQKVAIERVKDLQTQYIKMGRDANGALRTIAVRPLALDMENLSTKTQIAAQKQQLLNQLLKQGSTNLLNFGKNTQWAGRQLMVGFTIPLGILGTTAAKTFMDMEKQAIAFKRVYGDTFTATKETDAMLRQVQELASEFTKYGVAVEKTMEQAAKAAATGKMGADLLAQVTEATRLSVLGNVEQQQALETTISLTNAFGTAADQLRGKINFLNAVENQTITSIEDLTTAIPKAAPVIQQLGGDVEDLTFFLTAMREGGINASESANALKSGLASLINPTKKASDFLQTFGINITKIVESNKGDVKGLVIDFAKALDTLDPLNRARAIEQLFGKFQFSRLSTLFQNVIKDGSQAAKVLELTRQSSAELGILAQRELNRIAASPMYKFEKAVADFKKELAPVGEEFLKAVTPIVNFATDVLKAFNSLDGGVKQFIVNATGLIAGIGPVFLMTFGLLANGVANIIKGFTFVKNVFNKASSASTVLGETTDYMTQQQIEAAAVAASLEQVHNKLTQAFTVEATAVAKLTSAYQKAVSAQTAFTGASVGKRAAKPKKYADGIFSVPGPKGAGDVVPAMLSPGEAVIPAKPAQKYRGFIRGMISGKIPGFNIGTEEVKPKRPRKRKTLADAISDIGSDQPRYLTDQTAGLVHPDFANEQEIVRQAFAAQGFDIVGNADDKKSYGGYMQAHAAHIGGEGSSRAVAINTKGGWFARWIKNWAAKFITPQLGVMNKYMQDISDPDIETKAADPKQKGKKVTLYRNFLREDNIKRVAKALKLPVAEVRKHAQHLFAGNEALTPQETAVLGKIAETHRDSVRVTDTMGKSARKKANAEIARTSSVVGVVGRRLEMANDPRGFFLGRGKYQENETKRKDYETVQDKRLKAATDKATAAEIKARNDEKALAKADSKAAVAGTKAAKRRTKAAVAEAKPKAKPEPKKPTQARVSATPKILVTEQLGNGVTREVDGNGKERYRINGKYANPQKAMELASSGAAASPGGRVRNFFTGMGGKLTAGGMAASMAGGMIGGDTGNLISTIGETVFTAALLKEFIPKKLTERIAKSPKLQEMKARFDASKMGGKFAVAKTAATTFKADAVASIASRGLAKSLPFLAKGATMVGLRFLNLVPVAGQVALALEVLYTVATENQRKQDEISRAITETLTMTKDRLDKVNEFFGTDAKLSGIRTATIAGAGQTEEQASLAEQFRASDQFTALYKDQAQKLRGASDEQFKITMQSLALDLYGQGVGEEQVQIIIDAIKKEAQKSSLVINFKDFKLDTESGQRSLANSMNAIAEAAISDFTGQWNWWGHYFSSDKIKELSSQIAGFVSGMSQEFETGRISVDQFDNSFETVKSTIEKVGASNPEKGMILLNEAIRQTNPELANAASLIGDNATKLKVYDAAARGAALSQQLLADLSVGNKDAQEYLDYAIKFENDKNKKLRTQQKVVTGITAQQKNLQNQEKAVNDEYDKRIKALERINDLQEQISKQKQNELDLADALSRGDVFAAAQAMQKIRADQAALAVQQQKNVLEDEKKDKVSGIQDQADKLDSALSSAQEKLSDIAAETAKAYISAIDTPTFEEAYKSAAPLFILMRPDLWFADEQTRQAAFGMYLEGEKAKGKPTMGRVWTTPGKTGSNTGTTNKSSDAKVVRANGGYISGPGSGTSDSIPARLSNGEYVIRANAVKTIGTDALDKLNYADKFADGGQVGNGSSGYIGPRPTPPFWDEDLRKYVVTQGSGDGFWQIAERYLPEGRDMDSWWREVIAANTNPTTGKFPKLFGNSKVIIPGYVPKYFRDDKIYKKFMPGKARNKYTKHGGLPTGIGGYNRTGMGGLGLSRLFSDGGYVGKPKTNSTGKDSSIYRPDSVYIDPNNPMSALSAGLNFVMNSIYEGLLGKWAVKTKQGTPTAPDLEDAGTMAMNIVPIPGLKGLKVAGAGARGFMETGTIAGAKIASQGKKAEIAAKIAEKIAAKNAPRNAVFLADNTPITSSEYGKLLDTARQNPDIFSNLGNAALSPEKSSMMSGALDAFGEFGLGKLIPSDYSSTEAIQYLIAEIPKKIAFNEALLALIAHIRNGVNLNTITDPATMNSLLVPTGKLGDWQRLGVSPSYLMNPLARFASGDASVLNTAVKELDQLRNVAHILPDLAFKPGTEAYQSFMSKINSISTSFDTTKFLSGAANDMPIPMRLTPESPTLNNPIMKAIFGSSDAQAQQFFEHVVSGLGTSGLKISDFRGRLTNAGLSEFGLQANILDSAGNQAGELVRRVYDETVYNSLLKLDPKYQGMGFGQNFSAMSEELYRLLGIKKIFLTAGLDKGPYTWAKAGYQWSQSPYNVKYRIDSMIQAGGRPENELRILEDLAERFNLEFGAKGYPTPKEIADISILNSQGVKLGKEIFSESAGWSAVKYLENVPVNKELSRQLYSVVQEAAKLSGIDIMDLIPRFKNGGMFRTPYAQGGLAMLHDKEFVMNAGAVKDYGVNNLRAMNNGTYNSGSVYNSYGVNINVGGSNSNANDIARTVIREIKRLDSQNIRSTKV